MKYGDELNSKNVLNSENKEKNEENYYSLSHLSSDNLKSKQNLKNLFGLYYSSEEESEINTEETNQKIYKSYSKKYCRNESSYKSINEEGISENNIEIKISKKIIDENEKISDIINKKKSYNENEKANKDKNDKEIDVECIKEDKIENEIKINYKKENVKENNSEEKPVIENHKKKRNLTESEDVTRNESKKLREKYQKACNNFNANADLDIINKEDNAIHNQKNSFNNEYNNFLNYDINNIYINYPYNEYQNNNYHYNNCYFNQSNYNMNNSSLLYTNGVNINHKPEHFFNSLIFSKKKELNVDLTKIPVVNQSKILSKWEPNNIQEEKKDKKYNIKTKVYNPINNSFDKVIIHGKNQKRKHQINWLAKEAVEKEYEILQKTNYNKRRTTYDKYGW